MSLSCGFATNSIIPEAHQMPIASRRGIKISLAWRLDRVAGRPITRALPCSNRNGCDLQPLGLPDCSFTTSFAIRLGSVLGFAGVV
jgi:hypothetical protein